MRVTFEHSSSQMEFLNKKGFRFQNRIIQLCQMNLLPLMNNPYVNGVTLREQNPASPMSSRYVIIKVYSIFLKRYILWVSIGQRAAKL